MARSNEVNDIWTFLYDPPQEWYFRSIMGPDQAYVFDTPPKGRAEAAERTER